MKSEMRAAPLALLALMLACRGSGPLPAADVVARIGERDDVAYSAFES